MKATKKSTAPATVVSRASMVDIGKRLREARVNAKITQQEIARLLDVSKQLVSHWEKARSEITVPTVIRVAKILGVGVEWLLVGIGGGLKNSSVRVHAGGGRLVAIVGRDQILELARGSLKHEDVRGQRQTTLQCGPRAMAFEVWDHSMEPLFKRHEIIIVDPDIMPEPGYVAVFALLASGEILFRRYRPAAESKPAMPPFTLVAENPDFEPRLITPAHQPVFMGTKVEHIIRGHR